MGNHKKELNHKSKKASRKSKHHKHSKDLKHKHLQVESSSASQQVVSGSFSASQFQDTPLSYAQIIAQSPPIYAAIPAEFSDNYYEFPKGYNDLLGINPSGRVILYDRVENKKLARLLDAFSVDNEKILHIVQGPPGVGKSKGTLLWVLLKINLSPTKLVIGWIKLEKTASMSNYIVYKIRREAVGTVKLTIRTVQKADLSAYLVTQNFTCVVFDNAIDDYKDIFLESRQVLRAYKRTTKVIAVSSTQLKQDSSLKSTTQSCVVEGWTLEEFIAACSNDIFYENVKINLLTSAFDADDMNAVSMRREIVVAKHSIAGASARWMLECTEEELLDIGGDVSSIDYHISRVGAEGYGARHQRCEKPIVRPPFSHANQQRADAR